MTTCPQCNGLDMYGVEYAHTSPNCYEGVSEWDCGNCGARYGRWSRKQLVGSEEELLFGGADADPEVEPVREPSHE